MEYVEMKAVSSLSIAVLLLTVVSIPASAGSYQIYVNDGDVIVDRSHNGARVITRDIIIERQPTVIVETPIVLTQPVTVYPEPIYYGYSASYTQIISAPANRCWYQADPYTFLGDVFGYDYDLICR